MTCSKLDDSAIKGSGYAVTTVRLERVADISDCSQYHEELVKPRCFNPLEEAQPTTRRADTQ